MKKIKLKCIVRWKNSTFLLSEMNSYFKHTSHITRSSKQRINKQSLIIMYRIKSNTHMNYCLERFLHQKFDHE